MNDLVLTIRIVLVRAAFAFGRRLPLRSRVVLATAHAPRLGGNLAAIADDLAARRPGIPVVTLAHRPGVGGRGRIAAAWHAVVAGYYLATSRVFIVDDYFFPIYVIRKRPGTTIVQTWHACGAFKKVGYSVLDKSFGVDEALASRVRIHSNYDVCLVASQTAAPHYAEAFRQPLERFRSDLGIPRTDVLFGEEHLARTRAAVRERYGLTDGRRVILYAPTFRGDSVTDARATDDLDLRVLRDALGADHVLLVRLHPFIRSATPIGPDLADFAIDVSDHPDINELMLVERRARDRLLERDLRVRPAATGRWSSSRRTTRRTSASAASTSTTGPACPARSSRRPRSWPRTCGPVSSISSAWSDFAPPRSTSQMEVPQHASRRRSSSRH